MRVSGCLNRLPDARNKTLRSRGVSRVFFAKSLQHHPLLRADTKREENRERDQVRRTRHPIRDDERLADGIQHECQVHRVADTSINALRNELMLFAYPQGDRPIRNKVSVRAVEKPEADDQARRTADERAAPQRVLSERE